MEKAMKFTFYCDDATRIQCDLIGLLCFEDRFGEGTIYQALDRSLDGLLGRLVESERFKAKKGETLNLHTHGRVGPARILLVGGGKREDFQIPDLRGFAARVVKASSRASCRTVAVVLPYLEGQIQERAAQFLAEGAALAAYRFDKYITDEAKLERPELEECKITVSADNVDASRSDAVRRGAERGAIVAQSVAFVRNLVNEPAAEMTPRRMADVARDFAREHALEFKVLGPKECEKAGMGLFLAVARGSEEEPRFLHLTYRPRGKATAKKKIALVGKGITFDSGGLSLKPPKSMEDMKTDMAGAATVIAALGALADLGVPWEVHAIAPCCENMPSGHAYRLGDVIKSLDGKTVEITNTDAEGRLVLADALTYANREVKPDEIIDLATLTGACVVALGPHMAGVMGGDRSMVEKWLAAAALAGEEMWQLPLPDRLKEQLKSEIADLKNSGDRWGGALTAGLFLNEFVGETPWVHVDIAGPSSAEKEHGHILKGATGFGVATIVEYMAGTRE